MRNSAAILVICLSVCGALAQMQIPAASLQQLQLQRQPHRFLMLAGQLRAGNTNECADRAAYCSDCNTVQRCFLVGAGYQPGNTVKCSGNTPYCANGVCSATLPDGNSCAQPQPSSTFTCPNDNLGGYYPDPSSCQRYHFCTAGVAYDDDCLAYPNTVYSQSKAMCVPRSQAPCTTFSCPNSQLGVYQRFSPDPNVYYICIDNNVNNALMAKCPDNYVIDARNASHPVCVATCRRAGRLPYSTTDVTRYYECVDLGGNRFSAPVPKVCPGGTNFDATTERCVAATSAPTTAATPTSTTRP